MLGNSTRTNREAARGLEFPGVLDAMIVDQGADKVILVMVENRPWVGGELQLWQLQEKLNAYASFVLDGEMGDIHPELKRKPVCIQLRSKHEPTPEVLSLADKIRQQLKFMEIEFEVWHTGEGSESTGCCGNGSCASCE